ncbi:hypothetical protein I4U23_015294 [Adineta vaga]|nr:hypothetical protein I4U23_015294 [Adineta vaga]
MLILQLFFFCAYAYGYTEQLHSEVKQSSETSTTMSTKVLIIGAGIAGLEATRLLEQNGIQTIVLEARNRTGGRVHSIRSKNGLMLDMGARFIHGLRGSIPSGQLTNPIWDYIREVNIPTCTTGQHDFLGLGPSTDSIFLLTLQHWYVEYSAFVREQTRSASSNVSFAYYVNLFAQQRNLSSEQHDALYYFAYFTIADREGAELEAIGAKGYLDLTSVNYGEEPVICDAGYMAITDRLAKDLKDIRLNQIVTKINYTDNIVHVFTEDGQIYRADYVLLTVPLGVLKSKGIEFYPTLPQWKLNAIDRIGFGHYEKIYLLWDQPWWNTTNFYFFRPPSINSSELRFWASANKWNGVPIKEIQTSLQAMFPHIVIPSPTEIYMSNWNADPFSHGSYAYISINQSYEDPFRLSEPIQSRLLFAGEATSTDNYGYSHGALITARREVTRLLYVYELLPKQNLTTSQATRIISFNVFIVFSLIFCQFSFHL